MTKPEVLHAVPVLSERTFERVQRGAGVWPAVEQRQGVVVDQVGVDVADLKGGRDRQAVDPGLGGALQRGLRRGVRHGGPPLLDQEWAGTIGSLRTG